MKTLFVRPEGLQQPSLLYVYIEHLVSLGLLSYTNDHQWASKDGTVKTTMLGADFCFIRLNGFGQLFHRACLTGSVRGARGKRIGKTACRRVGTARLKVPLRVFRLKQAGGIVLSVEFLAVCPEKLVPIKDLRMFGWWEIHCPEKLCSGRLFSLLTPFFAWKVR
ncbi:hypothetical protein K2O51_33170 (plasmid) [Cupriavidus pinatubonensis]|uniref:hypothetical protein n=1 Tax=Cupriavidus pinatubonensis TaxID=248026 RepID=UPI001C733B32|nr:hypothetical protein [Cupriavidus pinatubonensis]QYY34206.1 hypothetical protein K2O51_33170 [Cupriavidus pinatubonensis]